MALSGVEELHEVLKHHGWSPRAVDDRTFRCTVDTAAGEVRLVARHAGPWLYLAVMPFLEQGSAAPWGAGKYPPRFLGRILAVNHNLVLVKFALDDEGDLTLRCELPTESMQRSEVETALSLLVTTTEQYRQPIREALIDAGRDEQRPSVLPDAPVSEPPGPHHEAILETEAVIFTSATHPSIPPGTDDLGPASTPPPPVEAEEGTDLDR